RALARDRLEAWPRAPNMLPSFETVARVRERLPQDDVRVFVRSEAWWARLGSNQRPLRCQRSALPLSYAPDRLARVSRLIGSPGGREAPGRPGRPGGGPRKNGTPP